MMIDISLTLADILLNPSHEKKEPKDMEGSNKSMDSTRLPLNA